MKPNFKVLNVVVAVFMFSLSTLFVSVAHSRQGGKDGGGGIFSVATFWATVQNEIVRELRNLDEEQRKLLSAEQVKLLLAYMQPMVTKVEIKKEQIYITKNGKKIPVDAANYPSLRLIELYESAWQNQVNQNSDVKHLILHEFMGVAKISDVNNISAKIFPPRILPIPFAAEKLECSTTVKYIRVKNSDWIIRDMPETTVNAKLSKAVRLNPEAECVQKDQATSACLKYANDFWVKDASIRIPVAFDDGDSADSSYFVDATINLQNEYFGYGWGGAARDLFKRNATLQAIWKLVQVDQAGKERVLTLLTSSKEETNDYSDRTTLAVPIPVPEFIETISANGFNLNISPYQGEVSTFFHSYNIAGFLTASAKKAGIKDREQQGQYIINHVLKGMKGNALPFRIHAECILIPE